MPGVRKVTPPPRVQIIQSPNWVGFSTPSKFDLNHRKETTTIKQHRITFPNEAYLCFFECVFEKNAEIDKIRTKKCTGSVKRKFLHLMYWRVKITTQSKKNQLKSHLKNLFLGDPGMNTFFLLEKHFSPPLGNFLAFPPNFQIQPCELDTPGGGVIKRRPGQHQNFFQG